MSTTSRFILLPQALVRNVALAVFSGAMLWPRLIWGAVPGTTPAVEILPVGKAPAPVAFPHFPSRLHAFVWRNWQLVPTQRLAQVIDARPEDILRLGRAMGLHEPPPVTLDQVQRSYITILRRNWHLLPYEQLLELLDWPAEKLAYTLRHDDGVFWKFGSVKPLCEPLKFAPEAETTARARALEIAGQLAEEFPDGVGGLGKPLFHFLKDLTAPLPSQPQAQRKHRLSPRFCHSYFAPFGDILLDGAADPYPDGYLARLSHAGADGVWIYGLLSRLAPFPWDPHESERHEERLRNLRSLVNRARQRGLGVYLYLNEPRSAPLALFESRPELKGVEATRPWEAGTATLCTSSPEVQKYLMGAVEHICRKVPDLAGLFTITASESLTNCWSHGDGARCPRCGQRTAAEVIAELNGLYREGIRRAGTKTQLIVWDWGWRDQWAEGIIQRLPEDSALMSVSEWSMPIERGGVKTVIGEYALSVVGPGPRATRHWALARQRGLKTIAKIQANNTWELSAVPYVPVLETVARHAANLRDAQVDGIMLGWSLGGYPSPNLEVVAELGGVEPLTPEGALQIVAERRFGLGLAPAVVQAWRDFSTAFNEFPFGGGLYSTPMQFGPSNLLWGEPTGYRAGPVGFPYDDFESWRTPYPPEVFIAQLEKVAQGFETAVDSLRQAPRSMRLTGAMYEAFTGELAIAETTAIHFRSSANQARFIWTRDRLRTAASAAEARPLITELERLLRREIAAARRMFALQMADSRLGFEASNQYYYVPMDLVEKVLNCRYLLDRWLPAERGKW